MIVLLLMVTVGSILVGWLVPLAFKSKRPFGLVGDILAAVVVGVVWAVLVYLVFSPMVGLGGWLRLFGSAIEAIGAGALALWLLRKIK